jgi:sulfatase maturation enzyme AslB (radical SAM superfamily)
VEIDALRSCKRIFTVCISLDGTQAVHDPIRRVAGAYDGYYAPAREMAAF